MHIYFYFKRNNLKLIEAIKIVDRNNIRVNACGFTTQAVTPQLSVYNNK